MESCAIRKRRWRRSASVISAVVAALGVGATFGVHESVNETAARVRSRLSAMFLPQLVDLGHGEGVEGHDPRRCSQLRRHDVPRLLLAVHFDDEPRLVVAVLAPPIRVREEMRAGAQEQLSGSYA